MLGCGLPAPAIIISQIKNIFQKKGSALNYQVLLGGDHRLLGLVVRQLRGGEVSGGAALGPEHRRLGCRVGGEAGPGCSRHRRLGRGVSGKARQTGPEPLPGTDQLLLGPHHGRGARHVRNFQEAGHCVAIGVVGAGGSGEAGGELGCGEGGGDQGQQGGAQGEHGEDL